MQLGTQPPSYSAVYATPLQVLHRYDPYMEKQMAEFEEVVNHPERREVLRNSAEQNQVGQVWLRLENAALTLRNVRTLLAQTKANYRSLFHEAIQVYAAPDTTHELPPDDLSSEVINQENRGTSTYGASSCRMSF